jgi:hypothetical protein
MSGGRSGRFLGRCLCVCLACRRCDSLVVWHLKPFSSRHCFSHTCTGRTEAAAARVSETAQGFACAVCVCVCAATPRRGRITRLAVPAQPLQALGLRAAPAGGAWARQCCARTHRKTRGAARRAAASPARLDAVADGLGRHEVILAHGARPAPHGAATHAVRGATRAFLVGRSSARAFRCVPPAAPKTRRALRPPRRRTPSQRQPGAPHRTRRARRAAPRRTAAAPAAGARREPGGCC